MDRYDFNSMDSAALPPEESLQHADAPFAADGRDILAAFALYVLAYLYLWHLGDSRLVLAVFALGFVGLGELLHWERARTRESWFWLGCVGVITLGACLGRQSVWDIGQQFLFLHLAAVYWLLSRAELLYEGETGRLILFDGASGFLLYPFRRFFLRIRTLIFALARPFRGEEKGKKAALLWSLLALLAAGGLFLAALKLLTAADAGFASLSRRFLDRLQFDGSFFLQLILSLPVGAYLFSLLAGTRREDREKLRERGGKLAAFLDSLRRVPNAVWTVLALLFCLLYLVFFVVQARYLFGAFTRTLPEGFNVAHYARRGFFELCQVMGVNFVLFWLVTRTSLREARENRFSLTVCCVLLAESLLFAVVAFSKLALYIDCFGFTPLRLQSSWLVCVLFAGCIAAGVSLLSGRKTLRPWVFFASASLSLLCLF